MHTFKIETRDFELYSDFWISTEYNFYKIKWLNQSIIEQTYLKHILNVAKAFFLNISFSLKMLMILPVLTQCSNFTSS